MVDQSPKDLETLVVLLEVAALGLFTLEKPTFTKAELFADVRTMYPRRQIADRDLEIVLPHMPKIIVPLAGGAYRVA